MPRVTASRGTPTGLQEGGQALRYRCRSPSVSVAFGVGAVFPFGVDCVCVCVCVCVWCQATYSLISRTGRTGTHMTGHYHTSPLTAQRKDTARRRRSAYYYETRRTRLHSLVSGWRSRRAGGAALSFESVSCVTSRGQRGSIIRLRHRVLAKKERTAGRHSQPRRDIHSIGAH